MTDKYVATTGNNGNSGAIGSPWLTISYGVTQVGAGDTLHIRAGTYQEQVTITGGGGAGTGNELIIKAYTGETVYVDGNNYTIPPATAQPGGTNTYGTYYDVNFEGLIEVKASYVTLDGLIIQYSKGRGLQVVTNVGSSWADSDHITNVKVLNCIIQHTRYGNMVIDRADNNTIFNTVMDDGGNGAPFQRPTTSGWPGNHPAMLATKFMYGTNSITFTKVKRGWGEGVDLSINTRQCTFADNIIWGCKSGQLYLHRASNIIVERCLLFHPITDNAAAGATLNPCIMINNEDEKFLPIEDTLQDIIIRNNLCFGAVRCVALLGAKGIWPFKRIKFYNNTFARPRAAVSTDNPIAILTHSAGIYEAIEFKNNIIYLDPVDDAEPFQGPNNPGITWDYNAWSVAPPTYVRGPNDVYGNLDLVAPSATFAGANITPGNFRLLTTSPCLFNGATLVDVLEDYFGNGRAAPYSIGFDQGNDNPPPPPGNADVAVGLAQAISPVTSGTESLVDTNFGGVTPVAALFIANKAVTVVDGVATAAHSNISFGAFASGNQAVFGVRDRDALAANTDVRMQGSTAFAVKLVRDTTTTVDFEAAATGFITNGVQINKAATQNSAANVTAVLFGGTDVQANVGTIAAANTIGGTVSVTGLAFQPNLIFIWRGNGAFDDSTRAAEELGLGICTTAANQFSLSRNATNSTTPSDNSAIISSGYISYRRSTGQTHDISALNADGFTLRTNVATGNRTFAYLALRINNASVFAGLDTLPASASTKTFDVGFQPAIVGMIQSLLTATATLTTNAETNAFGLGFATQNAQHSYGYVNEDNQGTTDTSQEYAASFLNLPTAVGTAGFVGTVTTMTTPGPTVNVTAAPGTAREVIIFAIEKKTNTSITAEFHGTIARAISVSEAIAVSESAGLLVGNTPSPSKSELIRISESVSLYMPVSGGYGVSKSEAITVGESVAIVLSGAPITLSGVANLVVMFTDDSTDVNTTITTWAWNFGDGSTATTQNPSHTYTAAGSYTVTLTVGDGTTSSTKTRSGYVIVSAAPVVAAPAAIGKVSGAALIADLLHGTLGGGAIVV